MITTLAPEDLRQIVPLLRDLKALHAMHLPDRFHNDRSEAALLNLLHAEHAQGARFMMYETEGVARGYLKWRPMPDGPQALCRPQRRAVLDNIYVDRSGADGGWRRGSSPGSRPRSQQSLPVGQCVCMPSTARHAR